MAEWEGFTSGYGVKILYETRQESGGSVLRVDEVLVRRLGEGGSGVARVAGEVRVNDRRAAVLGLSGGSGCILALSDRYSGGGAEDWRSFSSNPVYIRHGPDGICAGAEIRAELTLFPEDGSPQAISLSGSLQLPRLALAAEIRVEAAAIGESCRIFLEHPAEGLSVSVSWQTRNAGGQIAVKTAQKELTWQVPAAVAESEPELAEIPVVFRAVTYSGSAELGSREVTASIPVPESAVPGVNLVWHDTTGYADRYGSPVQGKSLVHVAAQAHGAMGSVIREITMDCGSLRARGAEAVFGLPDAGMVFLSATAEDSRGRQAGTMDTLRVLAYHAPALRLGEAYRANVSGARQDGGSFLKVLFSAEITPLAGISARYALEFKKTNGSVATENQSFHGLTLTDAAAFAQIPAGAAEFRIQADDGLETVNSPWYPVPGAVLLDLHRASGSLGLGTRAGEDGKVRIGLETDLTNHRITGLAAPQGSTDAATKGYVDSGGEAVSLKITPDNSAVTYGFFGVGIMVNATTMRMNVPLTVPFRSRPSVRMTGSLRVQLMNGTNAVSPVSSIRVHGMYASFITVDAVCSTSLPSLVPAALTGANDGTAAIEFTQAGRSLMAEGELL